MFDTNPNLIQDMSGPLRAYGWAPTPLVLIHDGGGTIFSYYFLGDLDRPVYGIYNPHYHSEKSWAGGIPEMARHYVDLIRATVPEGPIILGGWSLGGLLSLEMSKVLADDPAFQVLGIVMIDSVYPKAAAVAEKMSLPVVQHATQWNENTRPETRAAVTRCFAEAMAMVRRWTPPVWESESSTSPETAKPGTNGHSASSQSHRPPPVFLLRAREPVPVLADGVSRVDVYRRDRLLGWENYRKDLIVRVVDIEGHHFNIFAMQHLDDITEKLKNVCCEVETWGKYTEPVNGFGF